MNFKIPVVGSAFVFVLILILNIANGNSFPILLLRSLISALFVFGILFGVAYVFKSILKIDFTNEPKSEPDENRVDVSVGDETLEGDFNETEGFPTEEDGELSPEDISFVKNVEDFGDNENSEPENDENESSFESSNKSGKNLSVKDILGYDASAEDLAKAIKTKIMKEE